MTPDDDGAPDALLRAWCQDVGWLIVEVASAPPPEPEGDSLLDLLEAAVLSTDAPADRSVDAIAAIADGAVQADTPRRLTDAGLSPATIAWWLVWSYQRLPGAPSEPRRRALAGLRAWARL
ncbi:MAG TPA: hypothetical protein PKA64_22500, partial [Myxococcota bacterium]|nr:hypothetical protein [Myxococcota bacterium]